MENLITYRLAVSSADFKLSKDLIIEYLQTLGIDLHYMDIPSEFASMEQKYASPEGAFFLARDRDLAVGCVGIRKLETEIAELKRLYVKESYRGQEIGLKLILKAIKIAQNLGYKRIRLDVIPTLQKAKKMYINLGFYEIDPYFNNPVTGTTYMEKILIE